MEWHRSAKSTLTAIEMDCGDTLYFTLRGGGIRTMKLLHTEANVIVTSLGDTKVEDKNGGTLLHMACRVEMDGHPMRMERYVGSQESFYEPYVVNGMRIWFDGVADLFELIEEKHGDCKPNKQARFAVNDANDLICPQELHPWCSVPGNYIDIYDSYRGDDCWMGAYMGASAHGGLDINHPDGTELWAPIDIDDHYYFNSTANGDNNNRWRGFRTWEDGSVWVLQSHHLSMLQVREHTPIRQGTHYAVSAGVYVGYYDHTHFVFKVKETKDDEEILLDPWILFWQTFELNKQRSQSIRAEIAPFGPAKTGTPVTFDSSGSSSGSDSCSGSGSHRSMGGAELAYYWTFGDGGFSTEANPTYVYGKPGIYAVTLVVDDQANRASRTHVITVDGEPAAAPRLVLRSPEEYTFRNRTVNVLDVYGWPVKHLPHSLRFVARASRCVPAPRTVHIVNAGTGLLEEAQCEIASKQGAGWLSVERIGSGNEQQLRVVADAKELPPGRYSAVVHVSCPSGNAQDFLVLLDVLSLLPAYQTIVDDRNPGFYCTPYFWVGHRFHGWSLKKGMGGFCLTNGRRQERDDEFARFTPDLEEGNYELSFSHKTPFGMSDCRFQVVVRHQGGVDRVWVEPNKSRIIGIYKFDEGQDGYVELRNEGSTGLVFADAVIFTRLDHGMGRQKFK